MTTKNDFQGALSRRTLVRGLTAAAAAALPFAAQAQMQRPPQLPPGMNPQPPRAMQGGVG